MVRVDTFNTCLDVHKKDIQDLVFYSNEFKTLNEKLDIPLINLQLNFIERIKKLNENYRNLKDTLNKYKERYELRKKFVLNEKKLKDKIEDIQEDKFKNEFDSYEKKLKKIDDRITNLYQKMDDFRNKVEKKINSIEGDLESIKVVKTFSDYEILYYENSQWRKHNNNSVYLDIFCDLDKNYYRIVGALISKNEVIFVTPNNVYPQDYGFRVYIDGLELSKSKDYTFSSLIFYKTKQE